MRGDRLLAIVLHLDRHRRATAPELAARLEVSVRTIYRDITALQSAGVPLWTEPGADGGVRLVDGWRAPALGLTGDEAAALPLAGLGSAASALGLGAVMATAQAKLAAALPPELRLRAETIGERFHLDAPGWFTRDEAVTHLDVVADAVWDGRCVDVRYGATDAAPARLHPLGLVLKAGVWYLVATRDGTTRTYRVGRIASAERTDERVARPEGFVLATWWASASAAFGRDLMRYRVRLLMGPDGWPRARVALVGADVAGAEATAGEPDADGWRETWIDLESEDVALDQLVSLAGHVEVLEPIALRRRMHDVAVEMGTRHQP
ncbi:MAG: WYL domain-containing protein [Actinomycetota bacterium]|nr:WYL domain-containing protein [Actinomycetota bacterium]